MGSTGCQPSIAENNPLSAPPIMLMQDANYSTVQFLKALDQAIKANNQIVADRPGSRLLKRDVSPQAWNRNREERDVSTPLSPTVGRQVFQGYITKADAIQVTLEETPVPPDCQRLMQEYRGLHTLRGNTMTLFLNSMTSGTVPGPMTQLQIGSDVNQKIQWINQEIERVRTSTPSIAAQVPPFKIGL